MSGVFFIAPYDPKEWEQQDRGDAPSIFKVDIGEFSAKLKERWSEAETHQPPDPSTALDWNLQPSPSMTGLRGSLLSDYQTVTIEAGIAQNLVEFIIWYRLFIPDTYRLYLFRSSSFQRLELAHATSEDSVRRFALGK